ncbi:MAG: RagB/SusD family nutrient uptake outer membrane protein [Bacteroidales bacterium]|nr:RagB/SusD family nutrient uptake outer membrane protein [Bacteroidales bacterium]
MKRILLTIPVLLAVSCQNYLDVRPQGYVLPTTDEEFATIMHNRIREIEGGGDEYILGNMDRLLLFEGIADDLDANIRTGNNLPSYAGEKINSMQLRYSYFWETVKDCNIVIENLSGRSTDLARQTLAAAYAIKGTVYYNMLREYCEPWEDAPNQLGLPLVDKFDIYGRPARASLQDTYEYTLNLFEKSLALEPKGGLMFFDKTIVKALKARLLFWCEAWEEAAALCQEIVRDCGKTITPASGFEDMIKSDSPKGEVFAKSHINDSSELDWYFSSIIRYFASRPACSSLIKLFGDEPEKDVRYRVSFDAKRMNKKRPECGIRLSEIVLMLAECDYHLGKAEEALDCLNELRRNRIEGVSNLTMASLPAVRTGDRIVSDAAGEAITPLLQAIFDERRKELYMEGDRWFELKRNGRPEWWIISNGLKYTTKKYLYTAPIYKRDVDLNHEMIQNEGYE